MPNHHVGQAPLEPIHTGVIPQPVEVEDAQGLQGGWLGTRDARPGNPQHQQAGNREGHTFWTVHGHKSSLSMTLFGRRLADLAIRRVARSMPAGGSLGAGDEREKPPRAVLYPGGLFSERCCVEVGRGP